MTDQNNDRAPGQEPENNGSESNQEHAHQQHLQTTEQADTLRQLNFNTGQETQLARSGHDHHRGQIERDDVHDRLRRQQQRQQNQRTQALNILRATQVHYVSPPLARDNLAARRRQAAIDIQVVDPGPNGEPPLNLGVFAARLPQFLGNRARAMGVDLTFHSSSEVVYMLGAANGCGGIAEYIRLLPHDEKMSRFICGFPLEFLCAIVGMRPEMIDHAQDLIRDALGSRCTLTVPNKRHWEFFSYPDKQIDTIRGIFVQVARALRCEEEQDLEDEAVFQASQYRREAMESSERSRIFQHLQQSTHTIVAPMLLTERLVDLTLRQVKIQHEADAIHEQRNVIHERLDIINEEMKILLAQRQVNRTQLEIKQEPTEAIEKLLEAVQVEHRAIESFRAQQDAAGANAANPIDVDNLSDD